MITDAKILLFIRFTNETPGFISLLNFLNNVELWVGWSTLSRCRC